MRPLDQLEHEPPEAYDDFLAWVFSQPRQLPKDVHLARRWDWQIRASRYDHPPAPVQELRPSKGTQADDIAANLRLLLHLEVKKYLQASQDSPEAPALAPGELIRLVALSKDLDVPKEEAQAEETTKPATDYSKWTLEEFALAEQVAAIQRAKR